MSPGPRPASPQPGSGRGSPSLNPWGSNTDLPTRSQDLYLPIPERFARGLSAVREESREGSHSPSPFSPFQFSPFRAQGGAPRSPQTIDLPLSVHMRNFQANVAAGPTTGTQFLQPACMSTLMRRAEEREESMFSHPEGRPELEVFGQRRRDGGRTFQFDQQGWDETVSLC